MSFPGWVFLRSYVLVAVNYKVAVPVSLGFLRITVCGQIPVRCAMDMPGASARPRLG